MNTESVGNAESVENGDNGSNQGQPGGAGGIGSDTGTGGTGGVGGRGGKGERGIQGEKGKRGDSLPTLKITDNRLLFIFGAVLVIFALLAYRNEVTYSHSQKAQHQISNNSKRIEDNAYKQATFSYNMCEGRRATLIKLNAQSAAVVKILKTVLPQTSQLIKLTKVYQDNILELPVCGEKPVR